MWCHWHLLNRRSLWNYFCLMSICDVIVLDMRIFFISNLTLFDTYWHFFSWLCLLTLSFYKPTFMNWVFFAFKSVLAHKFLINLWVNWVFFAFKSVLAHKLLFHLWVNWVFFAFKSVLAHKLLIHLWVNWVFFAFNGSLTPNDRQLFLYELL